MHICRVACTYISRYFLVRGYINRLSPWIVGLG